MSADQNPPDDGAKRGLSAWQAIGVGQAWVTIPGIALFFGTFFLVRSLMGASGPQILPAVAGFVVGWAWWASMAPRWRRWALSHGAPHDKLRDLAMLTGLTWGREKDAKPPEPKQ